MKSQVIDDPRLLAFEAAVHEEMNRLICQGSINFAQMDYIAQREVEYKRWRERENL